MTETYSIYSTNELSQTTRLNFDGYFWWHHDKAKQVFEDFKNGLQNTKTISPTEFEFDNRNIKLLSNEKTIMENLNQKLLKFQTTVETIKKNGENSFFKKGNGKPSTYATLPKILEEVKPILNALKLVVTQPIKDNTVYTVISDTESDDFIESSIVLPTGLNAQQIGSCITFFRRYTICSLLALEIDEDDDGNLASGNNEKNNTYQKAETNTDNGSLPKKMIWLSETQYKAMLGFLQSSDPEEKARGKKGYDDFSTTEQGMSKAYRTELKKYL